MISQTNQCAVIVATVVGLRVVGGENVMNHFTATIKTCIYRISTHTKQNVRFLVVFTERMLFVVHRLFRLSFLSGISK